VEEGGNVLTGLRQEDFIIYDEDEWQPVLYFANVSAPVDIVLLLDVSSSMDRIAAALARTAVKALASLRANDRVALLSFTTKAKVLVPYTTDHGRILPPIRKIASSRLVGSTDLYRALSDSCGYIQLSRQKAAPVAQESQRRRVILMITDGVGFSAKREAKTLRELWEADAVVDAMIVGPNEEQRWRALRPPPYEPQDLRRIAAQTGGIVAPGAQVERDLPQILERSRTRYSLFYRKPEGGKSGFRTVRVDLSPEAREGHPTARLSTRKGYIRD
jgi:VWFA-related protein